MNIRRSPIKSHISLNLSRCWVLSLLLVPVSLRGASAPTNSLSERVRRADDFYLARWDLGNVEKGLQALREQVTQNPADYEAWWRISKFVNYLARHAGDAQRHKLLKEAVEAARRAVALAPQRVEGHFWLGAGLGLVAEDKSFIKALMLVDTIRKEMEITIRLDPDYEQASGMRTLARVDYRAPFFKGGNKRRSIELLEKCLARYPENSLTMLYLADSYLAVGLREEARRQLERILALCPDPLHGPEWADNQAEARRKLAAEFRSGK